MPWLISYQYRNAFNTPAGLKYGPARDDITVSDYDPAAYVGYCAADICSLIDEIKREPDTQMTMRRVTRIHYAMEVPESVAALECVTAIDADLDPDEDS